MLLAEGSSAYAGLFMAPENRVQEIANLLSDVHCNLDNCRVVSVLVCSICWDTRVGSVISH